MIFSPVQSMAESQLNSSARAIRKTALACLPRLRRRFPHVLALSSWNCPLEKSCEHDFLSRTAPWLN